MPLVIILTIAINLAVVVLFLLPGYKGEVGFDIHLLPMLNAIFNSFTFAFLLLALIAIKQKNIKVHKRFILSAFSTTALFLVSYVTYHALAESTKYGGSGPLRYVYFFVLLTHIVLAAVIVPLALISAGSGLNMEVKKHRRIAKWTMPLWLYVSFTGVVVYLMIRPYY